MSTLKFQIAVIQNVHAGDITRQIEEISKLDASHAEIAAALS